MTNTPQYSQLASNILVDFIHLADTEPDLTVKFVHETGKGLALYTANEKINAYRLYYYTSDGFLAVETFNQIGVIKTFHILGVEGEWLEATKI